MTDLKVLSIRDLLPIVEVAYANGVSPLSVTITGESFDQASEILINDRTAPEFIVLTPNRIIAQVPTSERKSLLRKVAVLAEAPSPTRSSLLGFDVGVSFKGLKGLERLVQFFCKILLQTPGSDKFDPNTGGGLLQAVGKNISRNDARSIQAALVGAVNRTRDQILTLQSRDTRIPADERLLTAKTEAIGYDPNTTTVSARVALAAVSGRQAVANLTF